MADTDWKAIKTEYITTDISQRQLAKKHKVPANAIYRRSTNEGWVEARKRHKSKVMAKTTEKIANKEANRLAKLMETTGMAIDVVTKAFADGEQFNRYIVERREKCVVPDVQEDDEGNPTQVVSERQWSEEQRFDKVDTKALKDLTAALKDLTGLMRDFYNIPTPAQAEAQRIAAERLELERRKSALGDDDEDETGVILMPPVIGGATSE